MTLPNYGYKPMEVAKFDAEYERTLIICADTGEYDAEASVEELGSLCKTAGAYVFGSIIQKLPQTDRSTYIGPGKIAEAAGYCSMNAIDLIVCDDELTPSQIRNIEDSTNTRVIDRTTLILDIFARNAVTAEGKLQVTLAQLKYTLPRLSGKGKELSRLGGGIGTRGPGESKLESDRRHLRRRIDAYEKQLSELRARRRMLLRSRERRSVKTVAVVGYTNAGKSTLMNSLTDAGVLTEDKLFATLDPTSRALILPDGRQVLLIDTVGFISRLPHELVEAFASTLEFTKEADLILNVCDRSSPDCEMHIAETEKILDLLDINDVPVLTVYNKCDITENVMPMTTGRDGVCISALTKEGLDDLLKTICSLLPDERIKAHVCVPMSDPDLIYKIKGASTVLNEIWYPDKCEMDILIYPQYLYLLDKIKKENAK